MLERVIVVLAITVPESMTVHVVVPAELRLVGKQERELRVAGRGLSVIIEVRETPFKVAVIVAVLVVLIETAVALKVAVD